MNESARTKENQSQRVKREKARFYEPPVAVKSVAGLVREDFGDTSVFTGSHEAIAEAGLLPTWMLPGQPGQPGQPATSVALRPFGERSEEYVHFEPGYMQVFRRPNGMFRIVLNVSREERVRRRAEREQRKLDAEAAGG